MPLPGEESLITAADLPALGVVAEALSDVNAEAIVANIGAGIDVVLSALGKRAKRPVTWVDNALARAMAWKATHYALLNRGLSGVDEDVILAHTKEIDEWLALVALGQREPAFVDSSTALHEMGTLAGSTRLSDERMRFGCYGRRGRRGGGYGPGCC